MVATEFNIGNILLVDRMKKNNRFPVAISSLSKSHTELVSKEVFNVNQFTTMYDLMSSEDSDDSDTNTEESSTSILFTPNDGTMKTPASNRGRSALKSSGKSFPTNFQRKKYPSDPSTPLASSTLDSPIFKQIKKQLAKRKRRKSCSNQALPFLRWKIEIISQDDSTEVPVSSSAVSISSLNIVYNHTLFMKLADQVDVGISGLSKEKEEQIGALSASQIRWQFLTFKILHKKRERIKDRLERGEIEAIRYNSWEDYCRIVSKTNKSKHWLTWSELNFYLKSVSSKLVITLSEIHITLPDLNAKIGKDICILIPSVNISQLMKQYGFPYEQTSLVVSLPNLTIFLADESFVDQKPAKLSKNLFKESFGHQECSDTAEGSSFVAAIHNVEIKNKRRLNRKLEGDPLRRTSKGAVERVEVCESTITLTK